MDPQESSCSWLSFAHQNLSEIPYQSILTHTDTLQALDLSHNLLDEYPSPTGPQGQKYLDSNEVKLSITASLKLMDSLHVFSGSVQRRFVLNRVKSPVCFLVEVYWNPVLLGPLEKLSTLVLDSNSYTSHVKFPFMPSVTALCINKNRINNLPVFVDEVHQKFPNIKILSMMNNEAAPSYFNGGTLTQHKDYRQYVISQIPGLQILDDTEVLEEERVQARKTYRLQHQHSRKKKEESSAKKRKKPSRAAAKRDALKAAGSSAED